MSRDNDDDRARWFADREQDLIDDEYDRDALLDLEPYRPVTSDALGNVQFDSRTGATTTRTPEDRP